MNKEIARKYFGQAGMQNSKTEFEKSFRKWDQRKINLNSRLKTEKLKISQIEQKKRTLG
jgi:hypothetical protein